MSQLIESNGGSIDARRDAFKSALLGRLKDIVDNGNADDPVSVSSMLEIPLVRTRSLDDVNTHCPKNSEDAKQEIRQSGFREFVAGANSWVEANNLGQPGFEVRGAGINPGYTVARHAYLSYESRRDVRCDQAKPFRTWAVDSALGIGYLPALICVRVQEIRRLIPAVKNGDATDGISFLYYEKPDQAKSGDPYSSISLEFSYQFQLRMRDEPPLGNKASY